MLDGYTKRLPGIQFESIQPQRTESLPRMDIAAFVGFASAGPLDTPVLVEDMAQFRDIFGEDLALAWDPEMETVQNAYLAPAVEAFFRNGGRRCWVVRVAKEPDTNQFLLPSVTLYSAEDLEPVMVRARSEGIWSDQIRVGTALRTEGLSVFKLEHNDNENGPGIKITVAMPAIPISTGDLLQLTDDNQGSIAYLVVDAVETDMPDDESDLRTLITVTIVQWFLQHMDASPMPSFISADHIGPNGVKGLDLLDVNLPEVMGDLVEAYLNLDFDQAPLPGDLIRINYNAAQSLLIAVEQVSSAELNFSPIQQCVRVTGSRAYWMVNSSALQQSPPYIILPPADRLRVDRVTFDIIVWKGRELHRRINSLAFCDKHPRFWGRLPDDQSLYGLRFGTRQQMQTIAFESEVQNPRFPLAGPDQSNIVITGSEGNSDQKKVVFLPIGMPQSPQQEFSRGPHRSLQLRTALERNGLKRFSVDLFLDRNLADIRSSSFSLLNEANERYYQREEPLTGIYSILPLEEVTLICVPDAIHSGWALTETHGENPLMPPDLGEVTKCNENGEYKLAWLTSINMDNATPQYELQEDTEPDFPQPRILYQGEKTERCYDSRPGCSRTYYYRVRVKLGGLVSPWSNTVSESLPMQLFSRCQATSLQASVPDLAVIPLPGQNRFNIRWSAVGPQDDYQLQVSSHPDFEAAQTIYFGKETSFEWDAVFIGIRYFRVRASTREVGHWSRLIPVRISFSGRHRYSLTWSVTKPHSVYHLQVSADKNFNATRTIYIGRETDFIFNTTLYSERYFRVRAETMRQSPWSNTRLIKNIELKQWTVKPSDHYDADKADDLLGMQRALIHFCAARGDLLAVLAFPRHYREEKIVHHATNLQSLSAERRTIPSFAALYHPWIAIQPESERGMAPIIHIPPDGPACGAIAARAIARGAWVAPANMQLNGALALQPALEENSNNIMYQVKVNPLIENARGFSLFSAETLSSDNLLRHISIRRLMILLRKLLLKIGSHYIFEPNNPPFRRLINRILESQLGDMYTRGAFSGSTPESAFRIETGSDWNTRQSMEAGRFIAVVKVAPSFPLEFLNLRLVLTAGGQPAVEEL